MTEHPNIPELAGSFPVVLYFGSQADADEFIAVVREAKPGLVARSLSVLETGKPGPEIGVGPIDPAKIEAQEAEQQRQQHERFERRRGNNQY